RLEQRGGAAARCLPAEPAPFGQAAHLCRLGRRADRRAAWGAAALDPDDDLSAGLAGFHQPMSFLDFLETEDPRRLGLVAPVRDAIDDRLERNLRERKRGRSGDESACEDSEKSPARDLEHRLERERRAAAEKSHQAGTAATA